MSEGDGIPVLKEFTVFVERLKTSEESTITLTSEPQR